MRLVLCLAGALAVVSGCVPMQRKPVERIPFPTLEYGQLAKEGTGVVRGEGFLKTRGGDVKTCAGQSVILTPATSYSEQFIRVQFVEGRRMEPASPFLAKYSYSTTADSQGKFEFQNVPPGEYFVYTLVLWEAPTGYRYVYMEPQGGAVWARILVKNDETTNAVLTWK